MRRRPSDVLAAWLQLLPVLLRIAIRRTRHLRPRLGQTVDVVTADSSAGVVSVDVGTDRPVRLSTGTGEPATIGLLSTRDDAGSSSAETVVTMVPGVDPDAARALFVAISEAAIARGNNRTSVNACDDDDTARDALTAAGFTFEGRAAPPWGDTRAWSVWSFLCSDVMPRPPRPAR